MRILISLISVCIVGRLYANADNNVKKFTPDLSTKQNRNDSSMLFDGIENQIIASSLRDGVKTINDSLDTLMDSVFYSLMDRNLRLSINSNFNLVANYDREVHETALGSYVVVDQFHLGPQLLKNLTKIGAAPLDLSTDGGVTIINITHQNDAKRIVDQGNSDFIDASIKNWFGLLPLLDRLLPVSFNSLELYDPGKYLKTPFLFPFAVEQLQNMQIGTIRSITLSGGIKISIDGLLPHQDSIKEFLKIKDLTTLFPYGLIKNGSHRISVMRKSNNIVWVAITDSNEHGHEVKLDLTNNYFAFNKLVTGLKGLKIPISPLQQLFSDLKVRTYDQIYSFDLKFPDANEAYKNVVRGDLILADKLSSQSVQTTGVSKKFTRKIIADEYRGFGAQSVYILNHKNHTSIKSGLSKILTNQDTKYLMFAQAHTNSEVWDLAAGKDTQRFQTNFEIKVSKRNMKGDDDIDNFKIETTDKQPFHLITKFGALNKTTDTVEFNRMLRQVSYYTNQKLDQIPIFATNTLEEIRNFEAQVALINPENRLQAKFLQPHRLGNLQISAEVSFPYDSLIKLRSFKKSEIKQSLADAFESYFVGTNFKDSSHFFHTVASYLLTPLRIFEITFPKLDFDRELSKLYNAVKALENTDKPKAMILAFSDLFDTPYAIQIVRAMQLLVEKQKVGTASHIGIATKAISGKNDSESMRSKFEKLNGLNESRGLNRINSFTNDFIDKYLERFTNSNLLPLDPAPSLDALDFFVHTDLSGKRQMTAKINSTLIDANRHKIYCYLRLEETGLLNVTRFRLGDKLVELPLQIPDKNAPSLAQLEINLSGEDAIFSDVDSAFIQQKSYDLYISLSQDKSNWSEPHMIKLQFKSNGDLEFP